MTPTKAAVRPILALALGAVLVAAIGAGGMYLYLRGGSSDASLASQPAGTPATSGSR